VPLLDDRDIPTPTGKSCWDRSTVWGILRNPAYAGRAAFGKTARSHDVRPAASRPVRLAGKARSTNPVTIERDPACWIQIPVPAIIDEATFELAARKLADNKRFAGRKGTVPSLLKGLLACQRCSYAYYRTSNTTSKHTLYYYRCLGTDAWRYEHGARCDARPVRADQVDALVWDHIMRLLSDPTLVQDELDRRVSQLRVANPATAQRTRLERDLTRTSTGIARLVQAYQEQLLTLDELRARMPDLRKRETSLRAQLDTLDAHLVDQETHLKLAQKPHKLPGPPA